MTTETTTPPRSRRALLAAALGAAAASVAATLGRPAPAKAAEGDGLYVGVESTGAASPTGVNSPGISSGAGNVVFYAASTSDDTGLRGQSFSGTGVQGLSTSSYGVHGKSTSNIGVWAEGVGYTGLYASSANSHALVARTFAPGFYSISGEHSLGSGIGVRGSASSAAGTSSGVLGISYGDHGYGAVGWSGGARVGVLGFSEAGVTAIPAAPAKTGVYGQSTIDSASRGVHGYSTSGRGVLGQATTGTGVYASATTGYAIRSSGRVRFDKAAGIATLGATASSVVVTPGTNLTSTSAVTATLMSDVGTVMVRRVAVNATNDTFTIVLTGSAAAGTRIAWHVFG